MITDRNLPTGTVLEATFKKVRHTAVVLEGPAFSLTCEDHEDHRAAPVFKSPSAAGKHIMGGVACNGWAFWSVEGTDSPRPKPIKIDAPRTKKAAPKAKAKFKVIRRVPNQRDVPDGSTRFFCSACMKSFIGEGAAVPDDCPNGHQSLADADVDEAS